MYVVSHVLSQLFSVGWSHFPLNYRVSQYLTKDQSLMKEGLPVQPALSAPKPYFKRSRLLAMMAK